MPNPNQSIGIFERQRPQKYTVHHREEGSICAHAKRQCDNRDGCKPRRFSYLP
jgi:hypothetical protein